MSKNRGMLFEKIINESIEVYNKNNIGIFHKKNLDIKFFKVNKVEDNPQLENAYISKKSTVDYYGIYKGYFIAFEAKSTEKSELPLQNFANHQLDYLLQIHKNRGISFVLIFLKNNNQIFLLESKFLIKNNKKIDIKFLHKYGHNLSIMFPGIIDFISVIDLIISKIENKK